MTEHLPPEGRRELATKTDVSTQGLLLHNEFDVKISELRREVRDDIAEDFRRQRNWIVRTAVGALVVLTGVIATTAALIR